MGEGKPLLSVYIDLAEAQGEEEEVLLYDELLPEPFIAETGFDRGMEMDYRTYMEDRHDAMDVARQYDMELPEVYGLAELFVRERFELAVQSDMLHDDKKRDLRRMIERAADDYEDDADQYRSVDDVLDAFRLGEAIDIPRFRDRLTISVEELY